MEIVGLNIIFPVMCMRRGLVALMIILVRTGETNCQIGKLMAGLYQRSFRDDIASISATDSPVGNMTIARISLYLCMLARSSVMFLSFPHERWSQMHAHEHGSRRCFS
jgi:hypothetical protein